MDRINGYDINGQIRNDRQSDPAARNQRKVGEDVAAGIVNKPAEELVNDSSSIDIDSKAEIQAKKRAGMIACETCNNRKYQDQSDDPGVSFKTAGHIDPSFAGAVVKGHEMEHVSNESARAKSEGREIIAQNVSIHTDICPECGRVYVSSGTTTTTTATAAKRTVNGRQTNGTDSGGILNVKV